MKEMKEMITLLCLAISLSGFSQEDVLLRMNYEKGDTYIVETTQKQDMGTQGGMTMNMVMKMNVSDILGDTLVTKTSFTKIAMDLLQGGKMMSYDSEMKEEALDDVGKMMKAQLDPTLQVTVMSKVLNTGEQLETRIEPMIPGLETLYDQLKGISYPSEKVKLGSSWIQEMDVQNMKTATTYLVSKIEDGKVDLTISGIVSGVGEGEITGNAVVNIATGVQEHAHVEVAIKAGGMDIKVITTTKMTKE